MYYAINAGIWQFARVFHVRDLYCPYAAFITSFSASLKALWARFRAHKGRVKGLPALVPSRHEGALGRVPFRHEEPAERLRGQLWGRLQGAPSSTHLDSEAQAKAVLPLKACAYAHGTCARNRACNARYRRKKEYIVQYGHSVILDNNCAH